MAANYTMFGPLQSTILVHYRKIVIPWFTNISRIKPPLSPKLYPSIPTPFPPERRLSRPAINAKIVERRDYFEGTWSEHFCFPALGELRCN
ncbi:hypothetical protein R1flu_009078 [Riccia fluitans]|uniref:Uncharacterized protein n=1 Tax=Riccia fluitans TaxID=41844 RepID=A0ABD1Z1J2_9MARC